MVGDCSEDTEVGSVPLVEGGLTAARVAEGASPPIGLQAATTRLRPTNNPTSLSLVAAPRLRLSRAHGTGHATSDLMLSVVLRIELPFRSYDAFECYDA